MEKKLLLEKLEELDKFLILKGEISLNEIQDQKDPLHLTLKCSYYSGNSEEYFDWEINTEMFILFGKEYSPEIFDEIFSDEFSPSNFYDLTKGYQEINIKNIEKYIDIKTLINKIDHYIEENKEECGIIEIECPNCNLQDIRYICDDGKPPFTTICEECNTEINVD